MGKGREEKTLKDEKRTLVMFGFACASLIIT